MSASRLATEHADAADSPGLLLWQVTHRWQAAQRAALAPFGLTHVQFVLLASLTWLDGQGNSAPVTQRQLADQAATDPMMTSQVLRVLERAGFVERLPHPGDRRAVALTVTTTGRGLANRAVAAVEACDRKFFAPLGGGTASLVGALQRLVPDLAKTDVKATPR